MRFFLISLYSIFFLSSCTLSTTKDFVFVENTVRTYHNPYFSNINKDYVYKANFEVYGHEFSGILIIKKLATQHHKVVFTTEFGTKMLDIELINDSFTINFIADDLNKRILINTLKKDFRILLKEEITISNTYQNNDFMIYENKDDKRYNYYFVKKRKQYLEKLINTSKTKEKVVFSFKSDDGQTARKILIEHKNIKLKIELKAFL
ncbi:hypothetical protein UMM65_01285 [Aureibaculum sp. 2210JD6-5]|uniref:hypothetical protein n=1 Tax=Aureibaculum sp. 2210JD6-5 TaxID=3103957 RepID=UPI002AAEFC75|nr:hypothetical protein [Aureibaculum sp. 2210JD6-5]MDY7393864.1 hypothetical protein [Aureibaculum sp. 2210JD6-5]